MTTSQFAIDDLTPADEDEFFGILENAGRADQRCGIRHSSAPKMAPWTKTPLTAPTSWPR